MKEKLLWSAAVLLGLMLVLAHAQTPARSDSAGRYQIVIGPANPTEEVQVFKLDTFTGKAWQRAYLIDKPGVKTVAWAVIPDYPESKISPPK
jgi:hypothetical protein